MFFPFFILSLQTGLICFFIQAVNLNPGPEWSRLVSPLDHSRPKPKRKKKRTTTAQRRGRIEEKEDGHGEAEASRARVPAPEEGSSAAGDAAVAASQAPVPLLSGVRPPRPPEDAAFRAPSAQEPRLLSMGSIRRLGFALEQHLRCLA